MAAGGGGGPFPRSAAASSSGRNSRDRAALPKRHFCDCCCSRTKPRYLTTDPGLCEPRTEPHPPTPKPFRNPSKIPSSMTLSQSFKDMLAVAPAPTQPISKTNGGVPVAPAPEVKAAHTSGPRPKASALLKEKYNLKVACVEHACHDRGVVTREAGCSRPALRSWARQWLASGDTVPLGERLRARGPPPCLANIHRVSRSRRMTAPRS